MINKFGGVVALAALAAAGPLQAAEPKQCIPTEKAESLVTYLLPKAISAARNQCSSTLPAQAPLMQEESAQYQQFVVASEQAWPDARDVVGLLMDQDFPAGMDMDAMRPFIDAVVPAMLAEEIKPKDCGTIDKVYGLLSPLPSANVSSLTVMLMQLGSEGENRKNPINICKAEE